MQGNRNALRKGKYFLLLLFLRLCKPQRISGMLLNERFIYILRRQTLPKNLPHFPLFVQSQTSILERISHHDLRKFGSLVSAVITKSWPRSNKQAVDDMDGVLMHLLTWPDIKHLFKLYGMSVGGASVSVPCACVFLSPGVGDRVLDLILGRVDVRPGKQTGGTGGRNPGGSRVSCSVAPVPWVPAMPQLHCQRRVLATVPKDPRSSGEEAEAGGL